MDTDAFDFFGMAPGGGFDGFGAGIAKDAKGHCGISTLLFIALEAECQVLLTQAFAGDFEALIVLLHSEEQGSGNGAFDEVIGVGLRRVGGVEEFQEFTGSDSGSGRGKAACASLSEVTSVLAEVFDGIDVLLLAEPALVAALTPIGHVLFGDGLALEFGGEDFFDDGEFVEPGEDLGVAVTIEEALVDLFAEVAGEAGDFAGEGVVGGGVGVRGYVNDGW
jgi:hypothetical protein